MLEKISRLQAKSAQWYQAAIALAEKTGAIAPLVTSLALMTLGTIAPAQAASLYAIAELPFQPVDINDRSQIVGEQFLWDAGNVTDLRTLPGANDSPISARAINNEGTIVGGGLNVGSSSSQSFKSDGSSITPLPQLPFCSNNVCSLNFAEDINDAGVVALNFDGRSAYVQQPDGTLDLAFSFGTPGISVGAINNQGEVVGSIPTTGRGSPGLGTLYAEDRTTFLRGPGYCDPFTSPFCFSAATVATDINELNSVVGFGPVGEPSFSTPVHALFWEDPKNNSGNSTLNPFIGTDLGTLGGNSSRANGINDFTQIVGTSSLATGTTQHAFLWEEGEMFDLNSLLADSAGWELTEALEINTSGQIIGSGLLNGEQRGFVLTPVPEPNSTLGLLGFAALGIGFWLKRQQQKSAL